MNFHFVHSSHTLAPAGAPDMGLFGRHLLLFFLHTKNNDSFGNSLTDYETTHAMLDFQTHAKRRPDTRIWLFG